jgi:two-component system, sensor histidine kinase LadS
MSEGLNKKEAPRPHGEEIEVRLLQSSELGNKPLSKEILELEELYALPPEVLRGKLKELATRAEELSKKSRTDELTGLLNRSGFNEEFETLEGIYARGRERGEVQVPTALLTIDLDGFKQINDTGGHALGNECLKLVAEHAKVALRKGDILARTGGDEFTAYLSEVDEKDAVKVAQKVRLAIESVMAELREKLPNYAGSLSASIGVVATDENGMIDGTRVSSEEKIRLADYASYVVKAAGKKGEATLREARAIDVGGAFERDFLAGKTLPR